MTKQHEYVANYIFGLVDLEQFSYFEWSLQYFLVYCYRNYIQDKSTTLHPNMCSKFCRRFEINFQVLEKFYNEYTKVSFKNNVLSCWHSCCIQNRNVYKEIVKFSEGGIFLQNLYCEFWRGGILRKNSIFEILIFKPNLSFFFSISDKKWAKNQKYEWNISI